MASITSILNYVPKTPEGIWEHDQLGLVSDNASQPASQRYMKECSVLGIKQIFAGFNNPKGNADTERVMRTIKEDLMNLDPSQNFKQGLKLGSKTTTQITPIRVLITRHLASLKLFIFSKINSAYVLPISANC